MNEPDYIRRLAELTVRFGANVQPGQIVALSSEPGKEPVARAVAEEAYRAGALFVDLQVFDVHVKRARAVHADPDTLGYVPPWWGERILALGREHAARISLAGPVEPEIMRGLDPAIVGRDMLPRVRESSKVVNQGTTNWTIVPCPTPGWAAFVHPELGVEAALAKLWEEVAHVCRLDEPDPVAAWRDRLDRLQAITARLNELPLDALRFAGPGTDLVIGLLPSSRWISGRLTTVDGVVHAANLPTEEVFTTPDPQRVDGHVRATKPLFMSGVAISGLRVRFEGGNAVEIDADEGSEALRAATRRDEGGPRLGEVALVDRESRIGRLGTVFYTTLLDENAASHIALGEGYRDGIGDPADQPRRNRSEIHIDFMIGSDEIAVTGIRRDGAEVPLLRGGVWQV